MRARNGVLLGMALLMATPAFGRWRPFGGLFAGVFRVVTHPFGGYFRRGGGFYGDAGCGGGYASYSGYNGGYSSCSPQPRPQPQCPPYCPGPGPGGEIIPPPTPAVAHIFVRGIPSGAELTIDGKDYTRRGTAPEWRVFRTPKLNPGTYITSFTVKYKTNTGDIAIGQRKVEYKHNQRLNVDLGQFQFQVVAATSPKATPGQLATPPKGAGPATVEWDLPTNAKVWLDGELVEADKDEIRRIITPNLDSTKRYVFDVVVEHDLDGKPEKIERSIPIRAGEQYVMGIDAMEPGKLALASFPQSFDLNSAIVAK